MEPKDKRALVIGGGIAGLTAALDLARCRVQVDLVEKTPFLGGHGIRYGCKANDQCEKCGACSVEKTLLETLGQEGVRVHKNARVTNLENGNRFTATVKRAASMIDPEACTDCGACYEKLGGDGIILKGTSKNQSPLYAVNPEKAAEAIEKGLLTDGICPEGAIKTGESGAREDLVVDSVVLATGFKPFDACKKPTYGFETYPNVVTGMELESGLRETGGLCRPSDGARAKKAAFIQCVGSRDARLGNLWCSQVCCAYALRSAMAAKHKDSDLEVTVFYMDIQNVGKNFPDFYARCRENLRFVRCIPTDVYPLEDDRLKITWADPEKGGRAEDEFDLLVLSVGITPGEDSEALAEVLGLSRNEDGFFATGGELDRTASTRPGIFLAGCAQSPKNILETMAHAGAAARDALRYMGVSK